MSRIRGKGNKDTELRLMAILRANGITGWRRGRTIKTPDARGRRPAAGGQGAEVGGPDRSRERSSAFSVRPDFVFPKLKLAVFVDGCFWHGCPKHATWPKQNAAFWRAKILGNIQRDRLVNRTLRKAGWRVLRIWEHELRRRDEVKLVRRLTGYLGRSTAVRR